MKLSRFKLKSALVCFGTSIILLGCSSAKHSETVVDTNVSTQPKVMAFARFVPERRDDFAWENDKVAFRVYGPAAPLKGHSSGVDAWLKKVDYSIIDKWYLGHVNGISYHQDKGEGYDPYHTGISRGVGGSAIWVNNKAYTAHTYKSYKVIKSGGDQLAFNLQYEWQTPLGLVNESKTVSLALGSQLYQVNSTFTLNGKPAKLPIAIGIATHDEKAVVSFDKNAGRISAWEVIDDLGLGTGVVIAPERVNTIKHIPSDVKDESHIWLFTDTTEQGELAYSAGFAWQGAGEITTVEAWHTYLDTYLAK